MENKKKIYIEIENITWKDYLFGFSILFALIFPTLWSIWLLIEHLLELT